MGLGTGLLTLTLALAPTPTPTLRYGTRQIESASGLRPFCVVYAIVFGGTAAVRVGLGVGVGLGPRCV